ncbi:MAG: DDE-type integrase/transposase/recombinase [Flammeovirgaceae bacterium]|nr:DDE-type integrase/transposase/recombinase [Flammeovirgaceae bacterium]
MPIDSKAAYDLLKAEFTLQEDINRNAEITYLRETFQDLYDNKWPRFLTSYREKITTEAEQILFAKSHALIDGIEDSHKAKWPPAVIYDCYQKVIRNEIDAQTTPVFNTISKVYFWRKISLCRRHGIPATLIHDARGEKREYQVKMTGAIKAFMRILFRSDRRYTISADDANGKIKSRQNGLPKITRFLAEAAGEQYQGDFYKLQMYCRNHLGIVIRLWAYVVLDVFSKKIVGWALSEKMLASQAKDAFKMAFVDHCFLPEEIIVDRDSVYKRNIFKRFIRRINNLGVITTKAYPNIPTWESRNRVKLRCFSEVAR